MTSVVAAFRVSPITSSSGQVPLGKRSRTQDWIRPVRVRQRVEPTIVDIHDHKTYMTLSHIYTRKGGLSMGEERIHRKKWPFVARGCEVETWGL